MAAAFSLPHVRLNPLLCGLLLDPMHVAHRGRAPVAARPCMEILEGVEVLAADTAALGQQGREIARPGTEGRGLFQQHSMAGEGFLESPAERHGITFYAGPFAEIVVRRQNLPAAVYERAHRLGVAPAEGACAGHPARYEPVRCRLPPHGYHPPRPGLRQGIGFCSPGHSPGRSSHMPSAI